MRPKAFRGARKRAERDMSCVKMDSVAHSFGSNFHFPIGPSASKSWISKSSVSAPSPPSATPSPSSLPLPTNLLADGADGADGADLGPNVVESAAASATIPAASNWIFQAKSGT